MNTTLRYLPLTLSAALLLTACSQEDLSGGNALPEGRYPLAIASVTTSATLDTPPQTRVAENNDGMSSEWEWNGTEKIGVCIGDGSTGTYALKAGQQIEAETPCYWVTSDPAQSVTAWYPADNGGNTTVYLDDQSKGLAYVLCGSGTGNHTGAVDLNFTHALAKVRVVLAGDNKKAVKNVKIKSLTSCKNTQGTISADGASEGWITMMECTRDGEKCWEANVVPGYEITAFQVNGVEGTLSTSVIPEAGKWHKITIEVKEQVKDINLSEGNYTITDDGKYTVVSGNYTNALIIQGSPTVTLRNANITRDGGAIIIWSGNPTFILEGKNTLSNATDQQSYVTQPPFAINGENTNVTIQGNGTLVVDATKGGQSSTGAIGPNRSTKCGNINILGGTIKAYALTATAIGAYNGGSCGNITIANATVEVQGWPAIGSSNAGFAGTNNTCGNILIENSKLSASMSYGWTSSPAIGAGSGDDGSQMHCGTITITNTSMTRSRILSTINGQNVKIGKGEISDGSTNSCGLITITGSDGTQTYSGDSGVPNG